MLEWLILEPELPEDSSNVLLHGGDRYPQRRRDPQIRLSLGHQRENLPLPCREDLKGVALSPPADHQCHDLRIERRATLRDAAHGIRE